MHTFRKQILMILSAILSFHFVQSENAPKITRNAENAMLKATRFMFEKVSTNGGFVWYYTPDLSRRWGELEATKSMIWLQDPGTTLVGHTMLDAYAATNNEYYYNAACKVANALIFGQSTEGGWNYLIDFEGDRALKRWYATIGKNAWRLEEYQHYYGNSTFDDNVSSDAARFLLRIYLTKLAPEYKTALDKAIGFVLNSQYSNGAWPQRYPLMGGFCKNGKPDYTSFYTYNDDVIKENVNFLIQCYLSLGEKRFLEPIERAMNFYLLSQDSSGGWGQQMDLEMHTAGARSYEPAALLPKNTVAVIYQLMDFYRYTGDSKFLKPIPAALHWLSASKLSLELTENGRYTHPQFVEIGTNKALYPHRKGSNAIYGYYYVDYNSTDLLAHYGGKTFVDVEKIQSEYEQLLAMDVDTLKRNSLLFGNAAFKLPGRSLDKFSAYGNIDKAAVLKLINELDKEGRWLVKHAMISHPYSGDGIKKEATNEFSCSFVGDETDTSPYRDMSDALYISTGAYVRNMRMLISFVSSTKK